MLNLEKPITLNAKAIGSPNLCELFDSNDLRRIGDECHAGYTRDEYSRSIWMKRNESGMDLALQIQKDKTFPWPGCSNVAFPLVTIAAMQFHARAYPAIVNGTDIVKCTVFGDDPQGEQAAHADRVSTHMSWQLLYQDKTWEEQEDKAILNLSIIGTNFKKSYYSASLGHNVSELVLAKDLVLDYWSKSVEDSPRKTHKLPMFRNEVYEKVMRGVFCDVLEQPWYMNAPSPTISTMQRTYQDNRQGLIPPPPDETTALMFLEQHCNMDLDGDGYAEPYIITFESTSKYVVRIVTRFDRESDIERVASGPHKGKIIRINAMEYFTKKTFIPSPDGGIYDIGFGVFLGPLNEAVNSLVNMLLDAGTMQTTGGGFLGRGAKIRGGVYTIAPFEWKRVDSTGDDLRKSIFPLPINAPSDVLFQLLSLLINYTSRVSGTTDITVGENPGQNTPAQTTQTMVEMGQKIYTAIFKRIWRSSKEEFSKLFKLNGMFLPLDVPQPGGATRADYQGSTDKISPVADPNVTSDSMRLQMAGALKQAAMTTPGYNRDAVEVRYLKALRIDGIPLVFSGTQGQPPAKDPKLQIEEVKIQGRLQEQQIALQAHMQEFAITLEEEKRMNNAKIVELMAKAQNEAANAQTEQAYAQVAIINAEIARVRAENEHINTRIEHLLSAAKIQVAHQIGIQGLATGQEKAKK
jgi:chaperonin GroES